MEELLIKYRPRTFEEVLGQDDVVVALREGMKRHKAFLFSGPSGVGKTTLARIVAKEIGASGSRILEIDSASRGNVEAMRNLFAALLEPQLIETPLCLIMDECHTITKQAWQTVLKPIEEPPAYLYICFCTTEIGKVLPTIKSRSLHLPLKPLPANIMLDYLDVIAESEKFKVSQDAMNKIVQASQGSPRQGLAYLSAVAFGGDPAKLIPGASTDGVVSAVAKALQGDGTNWEAFKAILCRATENGSDELNNLASDVSRYLTSVMLNSKDPNRAREIAEMILGLDGDDFSGRSVASVVKTYLH